MWEWLWGLTQAVTTPLAVVETVECQPGYSYSDWEMTREEHKYEGTWVVAYKHYERTRTDLCTNERETQRKVVGPFQLWPAAPHPYTESVSQPKGGTEVSGTPLRSTDPVGVGSPVELGPANGQTLATQSSDSSPTGAPLNVTGLVILAGALALR